MLPTPPTKHPCTAAIVYAPSGVSTLSPMTCSSPIPTAESRFALGLGSMIHGSESSES
ncbi:uncharacterized protein LACBIDRAFT_315388 [Laccaria bicolor S238N-H82]|uniref:Predicted protein n=1 Tax=Laccaria bicolor (strain S238N-H82 / ATCC MYA-4686) TaxID=486041 RepID=B0D2A0_LACBS|nr:uncharacterized protein LACBIDRAFT_315388 [Laccaria bicolor S238N-H82]EDR11067.1 predicted protein [Laccaria bicolor S238N-H82]|eukprot:XP_001878368.1 predicted protein [Laccaria bicolor S238N-H82]